MLHHRALPLALALTLAACGDKDGGDSAATDGADGSADGADGAADGADGAADGADGAADGADGASDGSDGSTDGSDGSSTGCVASNLGDDAAAFAHAAGTYSFSSLSTANEETSPWTNGTAYSVTVEAGGRVVYETDDGERDCCWDGANFDVVYGTVGESDLNVAIAEADQSNCSFNWTEYNGTLGRFSVQNSDYEVSFLY